MISFNPFCLFPIYYFDSSVFDGVVSVWLVASCCSFAWFGVTGCCAVPKSGAIAFGSIVTVFWTWFCISD